MRKRIFLSGRFIACINTYLYSKFKNNLLGGGGGQIYKPSSLSIKTLKNMSLGKDGKWTFFQFEILATNID